MVPPIITEEMAQKRKSYVRSLVPRGTAFDRYYPEVVISYATGRRILRGFDQFPPPVRRAMLQRAARPPEADWKETGTCSCCVSRGKIKTSRC